MQQTFIRQEIPMKKVLRFIVSVVLAISSAGVVAQARERIVGLPCEGCEAVFEGIPSMLTSTARIGRADESGEVMILTGVVRNRSRAPVAGVIVYAYQTNSKGIYPTDEKLRGRASHRHGTLRAWAKTNAQGEYTFETIRPAGYPGTDLPQHIHMHIIEPERCTYYIDDAMFLDDPLLTSEKRRQLTGGRGGDGISMPNRGQDTKGATKWLVRRDILLGEKISGYEACGR
jgi:protocatechuate 3,4-dioxygenase beta subunit